MVDRLTAGESRGGGKIHSIRRTVTVGVAAALLMTMGVGAAVTLTPAGRYSPLSWELPRPGRRLSTRWGCPSGPAIRQTV